jgi:GPH family glycoside/pentoside/hexuronide:cation symporter
MVLPYSKRIAFGMARFGSSFLLTLVSLTTFYVYGTVFELDWRLNGISLGISYLVIGLSHWLVGFYSDSIQTRYGRRKPFIIIGAPLLAIGAVCLYIPNFFFPIGSPDPMIQYVLFGYYIFFLCLFRFSYGFLLTPYQAMLPEITEGPERSNVSSIQNVSNWVADGTGAFLGLLASTPLLFIAGAPTSLMLTIVFSIALIEVLFYMPTIVFVKERPGLIPPKRDFKREMSIILKNRTYIGWIIAVGFLSFTFAAMTNQLVGFLENAIGYSSIEELIIMAVAAIFTLLIFLFIWPILMKRIGKRKTLIIAMILLAILLPFTLIIAVIPLPSLVKTMIYVAPLFACMACYYIMKYVVPADIAHKDEIDTGEGRAGLYDGFMGVPLNVFQAFSAFLLGYIAWFSFVLVGSEILSYFWFGPIYTPTLIIAIIILFFLDLDPTFATTKQGEE